MQESQLLYKQIFGIHNKENVDFLKKGENLTNLITLKVFERVHVYFNHTDTNLSIEKSSVVKL